jgi:sterol desaturase/sphingolipid hydroxylase (fatty acid hydroxylase superfamily)
MLEFYLLGASHWLLAHEAGVRAGVFVATLVAMGAWEIIAPRRALAVSRAVRWTNNLAVVILNAILLRLLFPLAAVGVAGLAHDRGWGLLNQLEVPFAVAVLASVVALDLAIYLQHVMFHAVPGLWRLHRMHHADLDYDVTTGTRFHPIEIALSMAIKMAAVVVLGPPAIAVMVFELLLNATSMFNHGNVAMPARLDRLLRWLVVTPDMHRVHHSVEADETNSNFGFNLPWWDRLFGTYRDQPRAGHEGMIIGIRTHRDPKSCTWLAGMLALPFRGRVGAYPINRRNFPGADVVS